MPNLYKLAINVLWMWNQNEDKVAENFLLEEGGKEYQVKGSGYTALDAQGNLRICLADNMESVSQISISDTVLIKNGDIIDDIWLYWKDQSGEKKFKQLLNSVINAQNRITLSTEQTGLSESKTNLSLSMTQVSDLVFEMEALLEMKKLLKGSVSEAELNKFIESCTEGFSAESVDKVKIELKRKNIIS